MKIALNHAAAVAVLLAVSATSAFFFHRYVFSDHLRHGMVEDGCVSGYAGELLDSQVPFSEKYRALIQADGVANGRYRPLYFAYQTFPFVLTAMKNGHYPTRDPGLRLRQVLNGDVRVHMLWQLTTTALALFLSGCLIFGQTRSLFYACWSIVCFSVTAIMADNIAYNDVAEIPQLIGLSGYLYCLAHGGWVAWREKRFPYFPMVAGVLFAVWAYHAKETSVALCPVVCSFVLCKWLLGLYRARPADQPSAKELAHDAIHLAINLILTIWLLWNVSAVRGAYSSNYKVRDPGYLRDAAVRLWSELVHLPWPPYVSLMGLAALAVLAIRRRRAGNPAEGISSRVFAAAVSVFVLGMILFAGNLPWEFSSRRYLLPVVFCVCAGGGLSIGYLDQRWAEKKWFGKRVALFSMFATMMVLWGPRQYSEAVAVYESDFANLKLSAALVQDLVERAATEGPSDLSIQLNAGKWAPALWYAVIRRLNVDQQFNVELPTQRYPPERVFMAKHPGARRIVFYPTDEEDFAPGRYDVIYLAVGEGEKELLESCRAKGAPGYVMDRVLTWRGKGVSPKYQIVRFTKSAPHPG